MKRDKVLAKMNEDRLEHYSRRENIYIVGVQEHDGESKEMLVSAMRDITTETGVQLGEQAISAVHQVGKRGSRP